MTTGEAAVAALLAHGLDTIYALPGVHNDDFFDALARNADNIRTVHTRHEQGAAYMALGAALATGKPQAYCVVPGPGLLNSVGGAPHRLRHERAGAGAVRPESRRTHIGRGFAYLHEIRDQAGIIARLVDWSARIRAPHEAPRLVAKAMQSMFAAVPARRRSNAPSMCGGAPARCRGKRRCRYRQQPIDEDAIKAAAKRLGAAKRPLIVAGGGAQDASAEVTQLAQLLQAPVLSYRRGRGVIDDRDPLSVNLPLGHELWAEADVVLAVGTAPAHAAAAMGRRSRSGDRPRRRRSGRARAHRKAQGRADRQRPRRSCAGCSTCCRRTTRGGPRAPTKCANAMPACASASPSSNRNSRISRRSAPNCRRMAFSSTR